MDVDQALAQFNKTFQDLRSDRRRFELLQAAAMLKSTCRMTSQECVAEAIELLTEVEKQSPLQTEVKP